MDRNRVPIRIHRREIIINFVIEVVFLKKQKIQIVFLPFHPLQPRIEQPYHLATVILRNIIVQLGRHFSRGNVSDA